MTRIENRDRDAAEDLAIEVLGWLGQDEERLFAFLQQSGLEIGDLRKAAREPAFLSGVLDHVMQDEGELLTCAQALGVPPERIVGAWQRMQLAEFDHAL